MKLLWPALLLVWQPTFAQTPCDEKLVPVRDTHLEDLINGKWDEKLWGYVEAQGGETELDWLLTEKKWVISPQFVEARQFCEGFAAVKKEKDKGWGFIDRQGALVSSDTFDEVRDFKNLFAAVKVGKQWTYFSKKNFKSCGEFYDEVDDFNGGVGVVRNKAEFGKMQWGFVDSECVPRVEPKYEAMGRFEKGVAPALLSKWGVINKKGETVIAHEYFSEPTRVGDYWVVEKLLPEGFRAGAIDASGATVLPLDYQRITGFHSHLVGVEDQAGKWAYADLNTGKVTTKFLFDEVGPFFFDLAPVRIGLWWGYIDTRWKWRLTPQFRLACPFYSVDESKLAPAALVRQVVGVKAFSAEQSDCYVGSWRIDLNGKPVTSRIVFSFPFLNRDGKTCGDVSTFSGSEYLYPFHATNCF